MENSDGLSESELQRAVNEGTSNAVKSILSTVLWTVLALFSILVGLQSIQVGFSTTGFAVVAFVAIGILIVAASCYLLYLLHWA